MSQSEDYLDGLLNSINKAKTDAKQVQEDTLKKQQEQVETRKAIAPEEDFFAATGIDASQAQTKTSHPYLRKVLSEEDFLRDFEAELDSEDIDLFISNFEQEIDDEERVFQETGQLPESENLVNSFFNNEEQEKTGSEENLNADNISGVDFIEAQPSIDIEDNDNEEGHPSFDQALDDIQKEDDNIQLDLPDDEEDIDLSAFIEESDDEPVSESEDISSGDSSLDDLGFSLEDMTLEGSEESIDDSLKEFLPDDMDALDEAEFSDGEEPDLSGEGDLDLDNLLEGDEDLLDIQSILSGDEEGLGDESQIDESAEDTVNEPEEETDDKGKKKKKKKEKKSKGEKTPNPIIQKLLLILFGPPDEDDIAEMEEAERKKNAPVEITYDEDGNPVVPPDNEGGKKKKKKEKKEKPPKEKKEKKEKKPKPPKPKKEKKPKEPDNSPKIPISIIATFLVLSISIISVVMVGMTFTGIKRHMEQANELFEAGDYITAYEKLNGFDLSDEDVALLRNQSRLLADLQLRQREYQTFLSYEQYNYALDSLIMGVGRYEKYKDEAVEYGVADQYDSYGNEFISQLQEQFGLTEEQALEIYNQPNRHYYTIELRKVLRALGLPDL